MNVWTGTAGLGIVMSGILGLAVGQVYAAPKEAPNPKLTEVVIEPSSGNYTGPIEAEKIIVGPGEIQYAGSLTAKEISFAAGTTVRCKPGESALIYADTITWYGTVTFECSGVNGANGSNGSDPGGWCVADDHNHAAEEYVAGGNTPGGDGTNGQPGTDASNVEIKAEVMNFTPGSEIIINSIGGKGGAGGKGGEGMRKAFAPSSNDCRNGTKFKATAHAPNGRDGKDGKDGSNGTVNVRAKNAIGRPKTNIKAGSKGVYLPTA